MLFSYSFVYLFSFLFGKVSFHMWLYFQHQYDGITSWPQRTLSLTFQVVCIDCIPPYYLSYLPTFYFLWSTECRIYSFSHITSWGVETYMYFRIVLYRPCRIIVGYGTSYLRFIEAGAYPGRSQEEGNTTTFPNSNFHLI